MDTTNNMQNPTGSWEEKARQIQAQLSSADDPRRKAKILYELGMIYGQRLNNRTQAIDYLKQALDQDPAFLLAASTIRKAYAHQRNWREVVQYAAKEVELLNSVKDKADLLMDMASIYAQHLSNMPESITCTIRAADLLVMERETEERAFGLYLQALSLSPQNRKAFLGLARICGQRKYWKQLPNEYRLHLEKLLSEHARWDDLLKIYQTQVENPEDNRQMALTYFKMGEIFENNLGKPDAALNAYQMSLALYPNDLRAFEAVRKCLTEKGLWQDLVEHLFGQLEFVQDKGRKISLLMDIARVQHEKLGFLNEATTTYLKIIDFDPSYMPANQALAEIFKAEKKWSHLYDLYQNQLKYARDNRLIAAIQENLGHLCADFLHRVEEALSHFEISHRLAPTNLSTIRGLDYLYTRTNRIERLIPVLQERAIQSKEDREKARAYARLGRIFNHQMNDPKQAAVFFWRIVEHTQEKILGFKPFRPVVPGHRKYSVPSSRLSPACPAHDGYEKAQRNSL